MDYVLKRSFRRTLSVRVTESGRVLVNAPYLVPLGLIEKFLSEKSGWIDKQKTRTRIFKKARKFDEGDSIRYLGNFYKIHYGSYNAVGLGKTMNVPVALKFRVRKELESWFRNKAREIIGQRLEHYSRQMGVKYLSVRYSDTSSKWGSCGPDNSLQFNWKLVMAPALVIDYVVIHELAHTKIKNHSRIFWKEVEKYRPAFRQYRKWLRDNGHELTL